MRYNTRCKGHRGFGINLNKGLRVGGKSASSAGGPWEEGFVRPCTPAPLAPVYRVTAKSASWSDAPVRRVNAPSG